MITNSLFAFADFSVSMLKLEQKEKKVLQFCEKTSGQSKFHMPVIPSMYARAATPEHQFCCLLLAPNMELLTSFGKSKISQRCNNSRG